MPRFKKGQTVYKSSLNHSEHDKILMFAVVERVVDSCGKKRVTFYDRGNDFIFGKSDNPDSEHLHETAEGAFKYLEKRKCDLESTGCKVVIRKDIVSDDNFIPPKDRWWA